MPNNGEVSSTLNCGESYTIPAGYHNGSGKVTANSLKSQTSANATASVITKGYTAWVNGVKITGTRVAPVKSLSGTFKFDMKKGQTYTGSITFSSAFDSTPLNISINCESTGDGCGGYWIEVTKKDRYGFSYKAGGQLYGEDTIQWRYTASL